MSTETCRIAHARLHAGLFSSFHCVQSRTRFKCTLRQRHRCRFRCGNGSFLQRKFGEMWLDYSIVQEEKIGDEVVRRIERDGKAVEKRLALKGFRPQSRQQDGLGWPAHWRKKGPPATLPQGREGRRQAMAVPTHSDRLVSTYRSQGSPLNMRIFRTGLLNAP